MGHVSWREGTVNTQEDHFKLSYFEDPLTKGDGTWPLPIAQVGPGKDQSVTVQFLLEGLPPDRAREIREAVERDLKVLVVDHWIPDQPSPWPYLELWAGSFGNAYAQVHWSLFPKDPEQWRRQHRTTTEVSGSPGSAATATNYFRRRLRGSDLDLLRTHPLLQLLVETVRNDDELDLQLRGLYVDIYYQGYNAFQIHFPGRKVRLGSEHDKDRPEYWPKKWMPIDDISTEHVPQALQWVKIQRDKQLALDERQFESVVVRDNRAADSVAVVLDRQIVQPGWKQRLDLLLYDLESERLVLAELKLISNKEIAGDVFEQLLRYQGLLANNPQIQATYPHVFEQKVALGLVEHDLHALRVDRPPLLLLLLAGLNEHTSKGKVDRLCAGAKRKHSEFRSLDVRVQSWSDFSLAPCRIPPISQLPPFEEWFERNVSTQ